MPLFDKFIGPAYATRSPVMDAEALINLYVETVSSSGNAKKANLYGVPGFRAFLTVATLNSRGAFAMDGRIFFVVGSLLYELNLANVTATALGTIVDDGLPVTFASNGRGGEQLAICGGGQLKILDLIAGVLGAAVALPLTNAPVMVDFLDGYFLLVEKDTIRVWFSALENGLVWNALDFFARSSVADNVVGIKVLRDKAWVFGSRTSTIYYDSGDALNPFLPYPGSTMQEGLGSPYAVGLSGEFILWLSRNAEGQGRISMAQAYSPTRISTPALDVALASYSTLSDCELLCYEQEGHKFACFTFPTADVTWCYDASESERRGEAIWHQRDTWHQGSATSTAWRARGVAATSAGVLVGDRFSGQISFLDLNTFTDPVGFIRHTRRAPYASSDDQWLFLDQIEMGIQAGIGLTGNTGQGRNPHVMLKVSRDGGETWDPPLQATLGRIGQYLATAFWHQLGRVRSDLLVIEVTESSPVRTVWGPGLWIRATAGSGMR